MNNLKRLLVSFLFLLGFASYGGTQSGKLKVVISDVRSMPHSVLICALFQPSPGFPMDSSQALKTVDALTLNGVESCEFDVAVGGTYAVSVAHDENGNRKVDTNSLGIPKEGWATSNDVTHTFRAPDFKESQFLIKDSQQTITLHMHY